MAVLHLRGSGSEVLGMLRGISVTFHRPSPVPSPDQVPADVSEVSGEGAPGASCEQSLGEIFARYSRYDEQQLNAIRDYWDVIRLLRKSGKVAGTVVV